MLQHRQQAQWCVIGKGVEEEGSREYSWGGRDEDKQRRAERRIFQAEAAEEYTAPRWIHLDIIGSIYV